MRILVIQNSRRAPAGLLGQYLAEFGADLVTVTPPEGESLPADTAEFDAALVLGGPQFAGDDQSNPYLPAQLDLMRGFAAGGKPVLGVCLGAQLLARAHGARVYKHSLMERGFRPITRTAVGAEDPVLNALGPQRHIMQWHYDTFDLPDGAVLLATGPDCANQAFRLGDTQYGLQFHPEVDAAIVRDWVEMYKTEAEPEEDHADVARQMDAELAEYLDEARAFVRDLARNWLELVRKS